MQALLAVSEVIKQLEEKNSNFIPVKANEPTKIVLLLSLGCGRTPLLFKIDVNVVRNWLNDEDLILVVREKNTYNN